MAEGIRMKTIEENIRKMEQLQQKHARSLNHSTRMKTIEENIRKMEQLQQQHARSLNHWTEQWWPSTNQNLGLEFNLEANSEEQGRYSTMELEVDEEATQPDAMEDNSLTILGPVLEDSSGEFSGIDGTDECQSISLLFEPPIVQSAVFNGDAMGLNRLSFLEGVKSENPSNPRLNPTPSNLGVRLNCVELGKEDHGVNGSRVLYTEMNNSMEDSTPQVVPSKVVQVTKESFVDAYHLFDEMPKGKVEVFQHSKVIFIPLVVSKMCCIDSEMVYDDNGDVSAHSIDLIRSRADNGEPNSIDSPGLFVFDPGKRIRVRVSDCWTSSMEFLVNINAHKVFVEKSRPSVHQLEPSEINIDEESQSVIDMAVDKHRLWTGNLIFDPGIAYPSSAIGSLSVLVLGSIKEETSIDVLLYKDRCNWVFDPGGRWLLLSK